MAGKENLQKFLDAGGETIETPETEPDVVEITPKTPRAKTRKGKKMASVFFGKDVHNQLSLLKIETGLSIQELLIKALNLLFQAYNKPPIAK